MLLRFVCIVAGGLVLAASPALADPPAPPTLNVPDSVTAEPQSRAGANVIFETSGADWKERTVPVVCSPASRTRFRLGPTRVSCSATDRRHQTTRRSFPVTVERLFRPVEGAAVPARHSLRFAWYPVERARLYNLQLWRQGRHACGKIASVFPHRERFLLQGSWLHDGRRYRLARGSYRWYAWPWLGSRYGSMLGSDSFSGAPNLRRRKALACFIQRSRSPDPRIP